METYETRFMKPWLSVKKWTVLKTKGTGSQRLGGRGVRVHCETGSPTNNKPQNNRIASRFPEARA